MQKSYVKKADGHSENGKRYGLLKGQMIVLRTETMGEYSLKYKNNLFRKAFNRY